MGKLQHNKGITLIALIVTIVVLLILAGVSIAVITGDDGVIKSANQAKTEQRGGTVEDRVAVWKAGKATSEYTHRETKTEDEMLNDLINDKLLFENEIDRENKKITIGSKEIDYATGSGLKLESDKGKEELILEYEVAAGDTIQLPYEDYTSHGGATEFNFQVNWGDGTTETGITNSNISEKSKHQYQNAGTYDIKIKGKYECLVCSDDAMRTANYDKLKKVKQWGTTGLKYVAFNYCSNLNEIVSPTQNSFINLIYISLAYTNIQSIPEDLFANCPNVTNFSHLFFWCENLKSIPVNLFANCPNVTDFSYLFFWCENLESIPANLFANCPNVTSFQETFGSCSNLTSIPEKLFANCPNAMSFEETFEDCSNLTSIPENLFANCPNVMSFEKTFQNCDSITSIPEKLFDNCKKVESFKGTFWCCYRLTGNAPELWKRGTNSEENEYNGNPNGEDCFAVCRGLENWDEIPDYWKSGEPE